MNGRPDTNPSDKTESHLPGLNKERSRFKKIGKNRFGHVRAGWRMVIYLGMVILAAVPVVGFLKAFSFILPPQKSGEEIASAINIVFMVGIDIALVVGAWVTLRWIDRRPFALLGMSFSFDGVKQLLAGLAFGSLYLTGVVLVLRVAGLVDVTVRGTDSQTLQSMLTYLLVFAAAGILEELANRGYLFQVLIEGTRAWIAILGFSFLFSLGHIPNEDFSWVGGLCLFSHGVFLAWHILRPARSGYR
jgi:membrane protease YdiL (CAAX protease family)